MDLRKTRTDPSKDKNGVWVPIDEETSILVRRAGNADYRTALTKLMQPYQQSLRFQQLPEDTARRILAEAEAEAILVGWKGMKQDGEELPYSKAEAARLLSNPEYAVFQEIVRGAAGDWDNFRAAEEAQAVKNSPAGQGG